MVSANYYSTKVGKTEIRFLKDDFAEKFEKSISRF
jgi:hypothetical protein